MKWTSILRWGMREYGRGVSEGSGGEWRASLIPFKASSWHCRRWGSSEVWDLSLPSRESFKWSELAGSYFNDAQALYEDGWWERAGVGGGGLDGVEGGRRICFLFFFGPAASWATVWLFRMRLQFCSCHIILEHLAVCYTCHEYKWLPRSLTPWLSTYSNYGSGPQQQSTKHGTLLGPACAVLSHVLAAACRKFISHNSMDTIPGKAVTKKQWQPDLLPV